MQGVINVRFTNHARAKRVLNTIPNLQVGEQVIVDTAEGRRIGTVSIAMRPMLKSELDTIEEKVVRVALAEDIEQATANEIDEAKAFTICRNYIDQHRLEMQLVSSEYTLDDRKLIFYFTADGRVDFRDLVRELAAEFKTRIELRQIGVRDDAKLNGGIGVCGRELCCSTWMNEFSPVSIRMAKEQNISMNPTKVSGACGRLLCCLNYENEAYKENRKLVPKPGSIIEYQGTKYRTGQQDILGLKLSVQTEGLDGSWSDPFMIDAEEIGFGEEKRKGSYNALHQKGDIPTQEFLDLGLPQSCCKQMQGLEESACQSESCPKQEIDLDDNVLVASSDTPVDDIDSEVKPAEKKKPRYILPEDI